MRFLIFLFTSLIILSIIYSYIGWRLIYPAVSKPAWKKTAWSVILFFLLIPYIMFMFRFQGLENNWTDLLTWVTYLSLGFFSMLFIISIARDLIWLMVFTAKKITWIFHLFFEFNPKKNHAIDPERRQFLLRTVNMGVLGLSGGFTAYGLFEAHRLPAVKEISIPISGLHHDLHGFSIAQITDIHVGSTVRQGFVEKVVDQVNRLRPDAIALTGDIADGSVRHLKNEVAPLSALWAPYGTFFVTGNHEYYSGAEAWIEEMDRLGMTVLINEHRILKKGDGALLLAGVPDYSARRFAGYQPSDVAKSLFGALPHHSKILLAHQPRSIFDAVRVGFDLQISGHTHGGQFFPWNFLTAWVQPYLWGLHWHEQMWIYVSRGTGYWGPPIRLCAPSEITLIKLRRSI